MAESPYREHIEPEPRIPLSDEEAEEQAMSALTSNGKVVDSIRDGTFKGTIEQGLAFQISYVEAMVILSVLGNKRAAQRIEEKLARIEKKLEDMSSSDQSSGMW